MNVSDQSPFRIAWPMPVIKSVLVVMILSIGPACRETYILPVKSVDGRLLVVDGFINNGVDSTVISLTRSFGLEDSSVSAPELGARVDVQGKDNSSYSLVEIGGGKYGVGSLSLDNSLQYRLHIKTSSGREYLSDYLDLKVSPLIDSITWSRTESGVQIYANTHDPQNASHYYRWDYQQTWEFNSIFYSSYQYNGDTVVPRPVNNFYTCWKTVDAPSIQLASTARLSRDAVNYPLLLIPTNSYMITILYSILVRQYVLTPAAYQFWSDLKQNTELIGSIFSPEPFQARGNIHSVSDSTETVIGYISAGTSRQQRIFISPAQIPDWGFGSYEPDCKIRSISDEKDSLRLWLAGFAYLPIAPTQANGAFNTRTDISFASCVDCTLTGTNIKPSFWP
jgi:hypothetical protein